MRIAFDMDGVLRIIDLSKLKLAQKNQHWDVFNIHKKRDTYPLLNPTLFALSSDKIFCVTNCMGEDSEIIKRRWLQHFYGDRIEMIPMQVARGLWGKEYVDAVAKAKLGVCIERDIDVYFDDDPAIIRVMRELQQRSFPDSHIKFLKYGAWIEEEY